LKAVRIYARGGLDQLRYEDIDEPQLHSSHDVIVKLKAAALNHADLEPGASPSLPRILGADGAGNVASVGTSVFSVKPGAAVCLFPFVDCGRSRWRAERPAESGQSRSLLGKHTDGTYAQYVRVPEKNCFAIPDGLSFEEAAAFPLVYLTAWRMLMTHAGLKPGESVLIIGAGGGVSSAALQLAGGIGARVFVTSANAEKLSTSQRLGADHVIHSCNADFAKAVRGLTDKRGVDVVVNCVGGATWAESLAALARGGRLVTCGALAGALPQTDLRRVFWNHLKIFAASTATRGEFLRVLNVLAGSNRKPIIDKVFPLADVQRAHTRLHEGKQFGKIVLRIDE